MGRLQPPILTDVDTVEGPDFAVTGLAGVGDSGLLGASLGRPDLGFECLQFIDPFCGGHLNGLQMDALVRDLQILARMAESDADRSVISKLNALADQVRDSPRLLMVFRGD